jgi:methylmalonyl-CoA/ethylmalonyl-CoA epimerase
MKIASPGAARKVAKGKPMITALSHVAIVVPDLQAAIERLRCVYGLEAGEPEINEQQGVRLARVDLGNASLEIMEPARADSPLAKFLARNPAGGIHHFCLNVDGVEEASAGLNKQGVRMLGGGDAQFNVHGKRIAFVHPGDFLGALVELEEHAGKDSCR